ncbi:LysR family transcriptional regulator [Cupriavidus basilensis]
MARAGEQEHIVASAISKRLAQLELTVGAALLERRRRGVIPTAAGEILLEHARAILAATERVARDMADHGTGVRGQVRLLATVSSMAESLPVTTSPASSCNPSIAISAYPWRRA